MWSCLTAVHNRLVSQGPESIVEFVLLFLLVPLAILYGVITWFRNLTYDVGLRSIYQSSVSVISVGNLAAGGTGKTPVVDFLVRELQSRGYSTAILSRGYGGRFKGEAGCVSNGQEILMAADCAGDEPFLLAMRNPRIPVFIASKRKNGIKLIEAMLPEVDIIVLDDGFQHRSVARDCNIVLLDSKQPIGNGWPLPAGNLREFSGSLRRADLVIFTRADETAGLSSFRSRPAFSASYRLSDYAVSLAGEKVAIDVLKGKKLCAFAGIAHPESFFQSLENRGLALIDRVSFSDHIDYRPELTSSLQDLTLAEAFVTTEKDAVKLSSDMLSKPCYQVPLELQLQDKALLIDEILRRLNGE